MNDNPKTPPPATVEEATAAMESVRGEWLRRPGVTAVDVGYKYVGGVMTDTIAVRVHVERKLPAEALPAWEVFNDTDAPDSTVAGVPVDVIQATYGPSAVVLDEETFPEADVAAEPVSRTGTVSPLVAGISVGNARVTAGTLGALVFGRFSGQAMMLSNFHVLAGSRSAVAGEDIWQPGSVDGGSASASVADLTRFVLDTRMDAAVATLNGARAHDREVLGLGTITGTVAPSLGLQVVKSGRTTGITRGVVDGVNLATSINYQGDVGVQSFTGQIRIVPRAPWPTVDYEVSRGGDSGSVWLVESTRQAVGLHFAGETDPSPAAENAIANPIGPIMQEFGITFSPVLLRWPPISLCDRYPALCDFIPRLRHPIPRFPWPPVPRPFPPFPPVDRPLPPGPMLPSLPRRGGPGMQPSGCGCGGDEGAVTGEGPDLSQVLAELIAYVIEVEERQG